MATKVEKVLKELENKDLPIEFAKDIVIQKASKLSKAEKEKFFAGLDKNFIKEFNLTIEEL